MKNPNYFDRTAEYNNEIIDLVLKLRSACNRNKIPMFVSLCVKNDEKGSTYKNEMVSAVSSGSDLEDDKFVKFVNVLNGFETVPKHDDTFDDYDDI